MTRRRSTAWAAALATGLLATVAGTVPADAAATRAAAGCAKVQVSAHRGDPTRAITENTLESFQRAANRGARSVESDLRLTSDGVWVLMHDGTVNRTTGGSGRVAHYTLRRLKALRTDGGQQVPTFDEMVMSQPAGMGFQLEFKISGASDAQLRRVVNRMRALGTPDDVFFTSRHREVLKRLSVLAPEFQRGLIMQGTTRLAPPDVPAYVDSVNVVHRVATAPYIARMHAAGTQVLARGATKVPQWDTLVTADIDRIVTGDIGGYATWCYVS